MNNKKPNPIGRTIKLCRQYNGLSQSELGEKVGFAKKTAGTRIGQYEGERIYAKPQITAKLARLLGIHRFAISRLSVDSELETLHTIFKIDMLYGLNWSKNGDVVSLSFPDNCKTVNRHLKKAYEARQALMRGEITYDDYNHIKNACGTYKKRK